MIVLQGSVRYSAFDSMTCVPLFNESFSARFQVFSGSPEVGEPDVKVEESTLSLSTRNTTLELTGDICQIT